MDDSRQLATCKSCGAPIYWSRHYITRKIAPIDAGLSSNGNVELSQDRFTYKVLLAVERQAHEGPLHTNHYATCPQAGQWKKK